MLPRDLDIDIWGRAPRHISSVPGFANSATKSHVLLAACREKEKAHEQNRLGDFTKALLRELKAVPVHKLTYRELLERICMQPIDKYVYHFVG